MTDDLSRKRAEREANQKLEDLLRKSLAVCDRCGRPKWKHSPADNLVCNVPINEGA